MRFLEIFRYELTYRLKSGATWVYAGILFLVAIWMFLALAEEAGHANAPGRIAGLTVIVGMFGMLVTAALFGEAAVRDVEVEMDALLFSSPVGKAEFLGGRFLGSLVVNALVMVAIPLGIAVATWIASRGAEEVGPFRLASHIEPYFTFQLPNLVLVGAVLFTIGMFARQTLPVYLGAIAFFIGYVVMLNYVDRIASPTLATLVDPLGAATLMELTQYWTEAERNTRLVGLPAALAWNRVVWLGVAAAVLALLFGMFRFEHVEEGGRRRRRRAGAPAPALPSERSWPVDVPRVAGSFGAGSAVRQSLAVARNELAGAVSSRWFFVVLAACVGLILLWGWNVGETVFDTSTWPVTLLIVEEVLSSRSGPLLPVLIALYAGELVWKQRAAGSGAIMDAAPVHEGVMLAGRFLALVALIVMFQAATMIGGLLIQVLQGYTHFELGLYLRVVFGMKFLDYVILAALAMTIHVIVNHKYLGHILVLVGILAPPLLRLMGLVRDNLLLYGRDPGWLYSDMNGFGPFAAPFVWFKLYWAGWALLLLVGAVLFWVRGYEGGLGRRLHQARERFAGRVAATAGIALVPILVFGGFVYYNTHVLHPTAGVSEARQAEYEKRYRRYVDVAQPTIESVQLRVEIHPAESAADLRGSYLLVNRTDVAIDSVHVFLDPEIEARAVSIGRSAEAVLVDEEVGYRIFALEEALEPGDSLRLAFDVGFRQRGFPNSDIPTEVVANGTSLDRVKMPIIGYQPLFELANGEARERFGLSPRPPTPGPEDPAARDDRWSIGDSDLVHVDAIIGTAADQTAITPGVLRRSWTENGRRYFHYVTETPIAFGGTIASAKYDVLEDRWNDVALRIFHHPAHDANLDRMVRGMKAALAYLTEQFGPYPYSDLRIVEIPRYGGFGSAHPHTIAFTEDVFFSRVREGQVDQPFYGTAHEVAHTWWGGLVRGAGVRGAGFLSESIANYSAMMVTEKTYGAEAARRVYEFQMERYFRGRAEFAREVPVLQVEDQPYIAYRRGAIALYTLRELLGEAAVNGALRRYFEKYQGAGPPYPTSLDLYAELRAVSPDSLNGLLEDLFETITLWDVRAERATLEPTGTGEYQVALTVGAKKVRADGVGRETEVPMDEWVEIGVFAAGEGEELGEPLYLERHRIRRGEQTIRITVLREPARAGIDPNRKLIDRQRDDNVLAVHPL
ncbi:MAG TPA: M1 family aminopeptidase [Gemmatimonadota bacterium]|nr:M1 family aminopeptidase [Gemmatimonadota bacterium]